MIKEEIMSKKIDVLSLKGEKVKDIKLEDNIFNIEPNDAELKMQLLPLWQELDKVLLRLKLEVKLLVVEENHTDKKELVMQDKEVLEHHIIDMVVLYLDQYQEIIQRK